MCLRCLCVASLWSRLGLSDVKNIGEGRTEEMFLEVSMISID